MDRVSMYLRKSRADEEIERNLGEGETLAKHRKALLKYAKEHGLNIIKIHEEIVSGESLVHRPAMLELLKEVEQCLYDAVLVMDIDRLGRGNMQEQGLILETFKKANTKIITPRKTYDLNNDFDEEYSEFEAFMSRKELKIINRRLQGGRVRSVEEGNYIGTRPPYGYVIAEDKNCRTLSPHPEQADVIRLIFDLYVNQRIGCGRIAEELNNRGYKSYTGSLWDRTIITSIIKNQVYIGKVVWKKKCIRKSTTPGKKKDTYTRPKNEWIVCDGKHPGIVSEELFDKAQEIIGKKYHIPYHLNGPVNPLAGIIICKVCGTKMKYRPYKDKPAHLICEKKCGNKSSKFEFVEKRILQAIKDMFNSYEIMHGPETKIENDSLKLLEKTLESLEAELDKLNKQRLNIHDLLEQGVYDVNTFVERSKDIADRSEQLKSNIESVKDKISIESQKVEDRNILPKLKHLIDSYDSLESISTKNALLKDVIEKAEYYKSKEQKNDEFTLIVYPKA